MAILAIGILIGFLGYLMINNINLAVIELQLRGNKAELACFIFLTLLFECLYCFFSLYCLQCLMDYPKIILTAQYSSILFLLFIGFWSLFEKVKSNTQMEQNMIRRGYWSVFVHPQQIPFWFFWGIILIKKNYLHTDHLSLLLFTLSNAAGSLLVLLCYTRYGNKMIRMLNVQKKHLKNIVGIICIASAGFLLYDVLQHRVPQ
jgi:threonine/homoserine/homoserine lactone efflux protein